MINYDVGQVIPIRAVKGQTDSVTLTITEEDGSASVLTGNNFYLTIHTSENGAAIRTSNGVISDNVVSISIQDAISSLNIGRYFYRVFRVYPNAASVRILKGQITVAF